MKLTCASKTFLLGEYIALSGGPTLLAATTPRFTLTIETKSSETSVENEVMSRKENPFHPESAAGLFWKKHQNFFKNYNIEFVNPVLEQGQKGGLGASSAEFLLLYSAYQALVAVAPEAQLQNDLMQMLSEYQELLKTNKLKPSGADLIAQSCGMITYFDRAQGKIEKTNWKFRDLGFLLIATGHKLPTHEHLAEIHSKFEQLDMSGLIEANRQAQQAFRISHEQNFIESVRKIRRELLTMGFEAPATTQIIDELSLAPSIRAAKGCGALGADVIFLLVNKSDLTRIQDLLSRKYHVLASHQDLSEGLILN